MKVSYKKSNLSDRLVKQVAMSYKIGKNLTCRILL